MEDTHERRNTEDNRERCSCSKEKETNKDFCTEVVDEEDSATCYVLMNSVVYGTEVWVCKSLDAAVQTLCRLARSAEQRRRTDGIQRYFCITGSDLPAQEEGVGCDPVNPVLPDADALTLTLHLHETCHCPMSQEAQERDMREVIRLLCREDEAQEGVSRASGNVEASEADL